MYTVASEVEVVAFEEDLRGELDIGGGTGAVDFDARAEDAGGGDGPA